MLKAPDQTPTLRVARLSLSEWSTRLARSASALPFGAPVWLELGATSNDLELVPVLVEWGIRREFLVPLCIGADHGQIGCFGYGAVYQAAGNGDHQLPTFAELAPGLCCALKLPRLHTLLPPGGLTAASDSLAGDWPTSDHRRTFVLSLADGIERTWATAKGSVRTAVRGAEKRGLRALTSDPTYAGAFLAMYAETLKRNGASCPYEERQIHAILADARYGKTVVVVVVDATACPQAATVFAVGAQAAFHIMQVTSPEGRRHNAGHMALWRALLILHGRGVKIVDLGSAVNEGQERFKMGWGGTPQQTRVLRWPEASRA